MGRHLVICPSMLASDFARLAEEADRMTAMGADWLHMDIMDGHFVPNITMGPPIIGSLRQHTTAFLDCHCMVTNPQQWVEPLGKAGASQMTFHIECTQDKESLSALVNLIKDAGMKVGIAIKPNTTAESVLTLIQGVAEDVTTILVMTVEPGFGGQAFMEDMMPKVKAMRDAFPSKHIQVDGGLNEATCPAAVQAGADVIVAGSAIFKSNDPKATMERMRTCLPRQ